MGTINNALLVAGLVGLVCASQPAVAQTDFGVRVIAAARPAGISQATRAVRSSPENIHGAALVGGRFGRITSIVRSAAHNRAVGGVANSWHLHGRAIDIARRAGVTHAQIAAALRGAGYQLVESLDEGDHSHFAFGFGSSAPVTTAAIHEVTRWGIILAPQTSLR